MSRGLGDVYKRQPIMYLAELVIVTVIAGIVPMFIISRMKVAEVIKPVD